MRQPDVRNLADIFARQQHVRALQVKVDDVADVEGVYPARHVQRD